MTFFIGFNVTFNTLCRLVLRAEETSIDTTWSRFCIVNCQASPSNYQPSNIGSEVRGECVNHTTEPPTKM